MHAIPILFENDDIIIVNKPSGIGMHNAADSHRFKSPTNENTASRSTSSTALENRDPESLGEEDWGPEGWGTEDWGSENWGIVTMLKAQLNRTELYLCHRLDTGTSGCLCLAKSPQAAAEVGELFTSRQVVKFYLALSQHKPKKKQGSIIGDMKNRRGGQRILLKSTEKPAITQFFSHAAKPGTRGFVVKPYSGQTHQIRVALKSVGAPILGDELYGGASADRLHLHAWQLHLPFSTGTISVTAEVHDGEGFTHNLVKQWLSSLPEPTRYQWPTIPTRYTTMREYDDINSTKDMQLHKSKRGTFNENGETSQ